MSLRSAAHAPLARINVRATPDATKCSRATASVLVGGLPAWSFRGFERILVDCNIAADKVLAFCLEVAHWRNLSSPG
jgi:hypothetical protein